MNESIRAEILAKEKIRVFEPFSDFLHGSEDEKRFAISLLDVARFSGHTCPSITGAFLICQAAVDCLYPETRECVRGDIEIEVPGDPLSGATGPIANVFGYVTGAWSDTGFGGLKGEFRRKNLLRFNSTSVQSPGYSFRRRSSGKAVNIFYRPERVPFSPIATLSFQEQWRQKIFAILTHRTLALDLDVVNGNAG